ncbi:Nramp family divalent metal transporter [Halomicroarcula sp. S1AR25-4]|uniref:Nramp family divalent metal transporter n=1 Tax=Haloarcula sp. S1AR25-4 TaxID=2950538 RepID=UPI00287607C6|nr:Nramp family divalent metal transporter [Halomicroarcula sp. S1AR25-4]MDS0277568.1 Nramp family divalent metal transporter [Halomicroarcula sp. S1AR25-4]
MPTETDETDAPSESGGDDDGDSVVYATPEELGYPTSTYTPVAYDNLDTASADDDDHPDAGRGGSFRLLDLPKVPRLKHVVGPSAIMLGASLGSGETLFWPQLVAQYGWALYWIFVAGVLLQFVVNTEIQRWTLATGESVFRGMERVHPLVPFAFMLGGFVSLGWPGWAASAAKVGAAGLSLGTYQLAGVELVGWRLLGIGLMVFIWLTYQLTPLMYNVVERLQLFLVVLSLTFALVLFVLVGAPTSLPALPSGPALVGDQPPAVTVAILLGGIAYAGAGGYLNLSQSLWVREKGYGMGRYQGRIKNPFAGDDPETVHEDGFSFRPESPNTERWRGWWRVAQLEHLLTFAVGLIVVTTILVVIAGTYAPGTTRTAVDMWLVGIAPSVSPLAGATIYATLFLALFTTEYAIIESFVRNSSDVIYELYGRDAGWQLPRLFWGLLTVFCGWGILILLLPFEVENPFNLLVVGAAMSGLIMWPYIVVIQLVNAVRLPEHTMPGWGRTVAMWVAAAFFGYFSVLLVGTVLGSQLGLAVFSVQMSILGSGLGGMVLWAGYGAVQAYVIYRTTRAKFEQAGTVDGADAGRGLFS